MFTRPPLNQNFYLRQSVLSAPARIIITRVPITASLSARERRRQLEYARTNAHRDIKHELDTRGDQLKSAIVSVPGFVRRRCGLSARMARVKVLLERGDLKDVDLFRERVRQGLVRVFPELDERGLLRASDDFDFKVGGGEIVTNVSILEKGLEKCETVGTDVFVEVVPHNLPPPPLQVSHRVHKVREKALQAIDDPHARLRMISFYKFVRIDNPKLVSELLHKAWSKMGVKGRVYVAEEGVNAQISVPEVVLRDFRDAMGGSWMERGETLVPTEIVGVSLNMDGLVENCEQPFEKLHVRPRDKILADGFDEPLDWEKSGREVPPDEWHQILTQHSKDFLLLDCRNSYESDVGRFISAESLDTKTFRDSWEELERKLQHEDREKKILTYCTGGIRCVKVNAFLEQRMGFTNTGRLQGGIVSYARNLREQGKIDESTFKGVNHVFDGRMGEVITDDLLDTCVNCGASCNDQKDCEHVECPRPFDERIFVQCEACSAKLQGACSDACLHAMKASGKLPENASTELAKRSFARTSTLRDDYADCYSTPEAPLLSRIRKETLQKFGPRACMMSSKTQSSFLRLLIQILGASRILEIGTFTGYATLAMASAVPPDGKVVTCEMNKDCIAFASKVFDRDKSYGHKIELLSGAAIDTLAGLTAKKDEPFDFAFIDADKGGYRTYLTTLIDNNLIRIGGILAFDNVLFRSEVSNIWATETGRVMESDSHLRHRIPFSKGSTVKIASELHKFNTFIRNEDRVEQVLLPFGDGLTLARRLR